MLQKCIALRCDTGELKKNEKFAIYADCKTI